MKHGLVLFSGARMQGSEVAGINSSEKKWQAGALISKECSVIKHH